MIRLDPHVHSKYSYDSIAEPSQIVKVAKFRRLQAVAITDHNTIKGGLEASKYADDNLMVIIGSEVRTKDGEVIGLFLHEEIPPNLSIFETIQKIHEQSGLAIITHPFDSYRKDAVQYINEDIVKLIDAVEVFNARSRSSVNTNAQRFAHDNNLKIMAGSDAHTLLEIGSAGIIINDANTLSSEDLRKAIIEEEVSIYGKLLSSFYVRLFDIVARNFKKGGIPEISYKPINFAQQLLIRILTQRVKGMN